MPARTSWLGVLGLYVVCQTLVHCVDGQDCSFNSPHMTLHVGTAEGEFSYSCDSKYLLVGSKVRTCVNGSFTGEEPECKPIPSVSFHENSTSVDMSDEQISIPLKLSSAVIRPFLVEVRNTSDPSSDPSSVAVEGEGSDFQLLDKTLNVSQDGKYEIKVNLTDTKISGRTKTFDLCLSVSSDTVTHEQRAELGETSCITVHILNTYSTALSFLEEVYVFTTDTQSLSFSVGYRVCDISLLLDMNVMNFEGVQLTIPKDCGEGSGMCIVNLHNQDQNFPVTEAMIGEYTAEVIQAGDDCKIVAGAKDSLTTTIVITLTPQQLLESATSMSFSQSEYTSFYDEDGITGDTFIPVHFDPEPKYPFKLEIRLKDEDEGVIGQGDVESGLSDELIDITGFVNTTALSSCELFDHFDLQLVPQTAPYVAKVTAGGGSATLTISYSIVVGFEDTEDIKTNLSAIVVTANRCFDDLNDYVQVETEKEETLKLGPVSTTDGRSSWRVEGTLLVPPLESRTLSLVPTQKDDSPSTLTIASGSKSIKYATITTIQFEKTSCTAQDGSSMVEVIVKATSKAPLPGKLGNLEDLVEIKDITKPNTTTVSDGVWKVSVVADESVTLELSVRDEFKQYIALGDMNKCTIEGVKPLAQATNPTDPTASTTHSSTAESSFSFTAIIVVFVIVLALGVAVYVAYSKKDQIIDWVKGTGGGGGGRGSGGHKQSRTRTRGRGAYKKLPTSVQDAMKHND